MKIMTGREAREFKVVQNDGMRRKPTDVDISEEMSLDDDAVLIIKDISEERITLEDAVEQGIVKLGDYISYPLEKNSYWIDTELTGYSMPQQLQTEYLGWKLDIVYGMLALVANDATESKLILQGKTGYDRGIEAIDTVQKELYTNKMLAQLVVPMTKEMWYQLQKCNRKVTSYHWLASKREFELSGMKFYGIDEVGTLEMPGISLMNNDVSREKGIRPLIFLKPRLRLKEVGIDLRVNRKIWTL